MKTFLVTMEDAPTTKWLFDDQTIATTIQYCSASAANADTTGPRPKVTCVCLNLKNTEALRRILESQVLINDTRVLVESGGPPTREQIENQPPPTLSFLKR